MMAPVETDYYDMLQVSPQASFEVIARQYYKLALPYHPDTCRDPAGRARARSLYTAYSVLENPIFRETYNFHGSKAPFNPNMPLGPTDVFDKVFGHSQLVFLVGHMPFVDSLIELWIRRTLANIEAYTIHISANDSGDFSQDQVGHGKRPQFDHVSAVLDVQKRSERLSCFSKQHNARVSQLTKNLAQTLSCYTDSPGDAAAAKAFKNTVETLIDGIHETDNGCMILDICAHVFDTKGNEYFKIFSCSTSQSSSCPIPLQSVKDLFTKSEAFLQDIDSAIKGNSIDTSSDDRPCDSGVDPRQVIPDIIDHAIKEDVYNVMDTVCNEVLYAKNVGARAARLRAQGLILMAKAIGDMFTNRKEILHLPDTGTNRAR
ncbi:DnaJ-like protein [Dimargaris verticillata]|uniref:DnaJ-like protein n=1 Tax=Dimargaris verticillata TaxID=2761393 RepID=A0A9W8B1K6_9FUNG|nr:DnaJ-like protein [Dimargaris verticillata]